MGFQNVSDRIFFCGIALEHRESDRSTGGGRLYRLLFRWHRKYNESSFFDRGLQACNRLIAKRSGKEQLSRAYAGRGAWQFKKKNYDAALADYDRALSIDAENIEFYDYRADAWMAKGDLSRAIDNYDQVIRLDPTYAAAYYSRGRAYEKNGEIDRARQLSSGVGTSEGAQTKDGGAHPGMGAAKCREAPEGIG